MKQKLNRRKYFKGYKKLKNIKMFEEFGMNEKEWKFTIDIADIWENNEFDDDFGKKIYDRIMKDFEEIKKIVGEEEADDLSNILEYIRDSSHTDEFDNAFDDFYDWADDNEIWVNTMEISK